jgi:hypothetical protein
LQQQKFALAACTGKICTCAAFGIMLARFLLKDAREKPLTPYAQE